MEIFLNLTNVFLTITILIVVVVKDSLQETKQLDLGNGKLCSPAVERKVKYESLLVTEGRAGDHLVQWALPDMCQFEFQSVYTRGGVIAVIQKLQLRKNYTTMECIDYIQFRSKRGVASPRYCGIIDGRMNMDYDKDNAPATVVPQFYPISYSNAFFDIDGELNVVIYIAKEPLETSEKTEFEVVFTSYQDCSSSHRLKHVILKDCWENQKLCINKNYFGDGYVNCPYFKCVDEGGCQLNIHLPEKISVGSRVIIGSVSTLAILFAVFILIIWAFKKHKMFCWAEEFAHPTTSETNRNSRIMEMNEQTGARLAETHTSNIHPSAPLPAEEKDLPPSYESLFPAGVPTR
ncbi:uncharacterized protein [Euwallacea similis]|uniref:uncharacterized protein n=1 Tax=Euwallacea similis TaxID=1736056 RepID=UPI00344E40D1